MDRYKEKFGEAPPMGHVLTGYSAVEAYARAVEKAGSVEADKVKAVLDSFSNEELLIGPTTFEPDLHINLNRPMLLMEMTNGKYTAIGRFSAEQVERPKF